MSKRDLYPSEKLDQYMLRFPDGMRDYLKLQAEKNKRSLNAEIIARLESTIPTPSNEEDTFSLEAIEAEFARLLGRTLDTVRKAKSTSTEAPPQKSKPRKRGKEDPEGAN